MEQSTDQSVNQAFEQAFQQFLATSSPRRRYYQRLLKDYLPYKSFKAATIRGNIQTRLKKILESNKHDGLFMAKAAIDRVFKYGEKVDKAEFKKFINYYNKNIKDV